LLEVLLIPFAEPWGCSQRFHAVERVAATATNAEWRFDQAVICVAK
jgi:hypothetical protein